jgi:ubiquinone/menaquinone biosynthesis C-methylase UbiE
MKNKDSVAMSREEFSRWSEKYDRGFLDYFVFSRVQRKVIGILGKLENRKFLDLGCGTGSMLIKLARSNPSSRFTGIDLTEKMIGRARIKSRGIENIEFIVGEASSLQLEKENFDYITSTLSFHHWPSQLETLKNLKEFLKPDGKLIISDLCFPILAGKGTVNVASSREMKNLFYEAGFSQVNQTSSTYSGKYWKLGSLAGVALSTYGLVYSSPLAYGGYALMAAGIIGSITDYVTKITIGKNGDHDNNV